MENIRQTVENYFYVMKLMWNISKKRVVCTGMQMSLSQYEYLFFHGVFLRKVLTFVEIGSSYREVSMFLFHVAGLFFFVNIFNSWYENCLKPITDIEVYKGLYHLFHEKACNVDLACIEDSVYYDKYKKVLEESVQKTLSVLDNFWSIFTGAAAAVVSWYMMVRLDSLVVLFIIAPMIGNFVFAESINKLTQHIYEESGIFRRITDYVNQVVCSKGYAKELRMTDIYDVLKEKQQKAEDEIIRIMDRYAVRNILLGWGYLFFTFTVIFEGVIFYGVYRCLVSKTMLFSQFAILLSLMTAVSWILVHDVRFFMESFQNSLYIQSMKEFMEYQPMIPEDTDGIMPDRNIHLVEFRNVSFTYEGTEKTVLKDISFRLTEKETCALVGYNGAGKTTLIKLLLRFYDPTEGVILVNGIDIRKYNLKAYRKLFAASFQDGKIFAFSVRDNVQMGRKKEEDINISNALCYAGLEGFVEKLPRGLDTVLTRESDELGMELSGSQRQKLLAARVFAVDAPICIYDEPTSALDPTSEYELMNSINEAGKNKIVLIISHRLSCVQDAQRILFLDNGRIAEQGTFTQLMERKGKYADMYRMQAEVYQADIENDLAASYSEDLSSDTKQNTYSRFGNTDTWREVLEE